MEVLHWARERRLRTFIEIKKGGKAYLGIEEAVLGEVESARAASLSTIISFDFLTLRRLRQLDATIALGLDFTRPRWALRRAKPIRATTLLPHWAFASRRLIRHAQASALQVIVWHVDQPRAMRHKLLDGVDGIITRYPAKLAEVLAKLETEVPGWATK